MGKLLLGSCAGSGRRVCTCGPGPLVAQSMFRIPRPHCGRRRQVGQPAPAVARRTASWAPPGVPSAPVDFGRWVAPSLLVRHLPYHELALSNLLTDVLELLLMLLLLAYLLGSWHVVAHSQWRCWPLAKTRTDTRHDWRRDKSTHPQRKRSAVGDSCHRAVTRGRSDRRRCRVRRGYHSAYRARTSFLQIHPVVQRDLTSALREL